MSTGRVSVSPAAVMTAVVAISAAGAESLSGPRRLLEAVVKHVGELLGADLTVWLFGAGDDPPTVASNHTPELAAALRQVFSVIPTEPVVTAPTEAGGAWLCEYDLAGCATFPLTVHDGVRGALVATRPAAADPFGEEESSLLGSLARLASLGVEHTRMVSDTLAAMDDLRQQTELQDAISDALITCDALGLVVNWNSGAERIYGYSHSEALGCDLFALLDTRFAGNDGQSVDRQHVLEQVAAEGRWDGELRERHASGTAVITLSSLSSLSTGIGAGFVAVNRDITAQRQEQYRAMHDPLTGLPNRRMLDTQLTAALAAARRTGGNLAVLFLDLDAFKPINDTHGHNAGDQVLRTMAARLASCLRGTDTVGRLGGDEFVAILPRCGRPHRVRAIAERVAAEIRSPITLGSTDVSVHASIGVAFATAETTSAEDLIHAADKAMYEAKRQASGIVFAPK